MEDSEAFGTHTEVLARENLISHAGSNFFHCPDELNIIDFYGPCDYDPHGKDAVQTQKRDLQRRLKREYNNN